MFSLVKEGLKGERFSSNQEVIGAVQNRLKRKPKTFSLTEFKKNCETLEPVR
jgi:hypothetical protein